MPSIVRECDWQIPALRQFKALPEDGKAVVSRHWHSMEEGFRNVADGLRSLLEKHPGGVPPIWWTPRQRREGDGLHTAQDAGLIALPVFWYQQSSNVIKVVVGEGFEPSKA